jgi:hypothetical protein
MGVGFKIGLGGTYPPATYPPALHDETQASLRRGFFCTEKGSQVGSEVVLIARAGSLVLIGGGAGFFRAEVRGEAGRDRPIDRVGFHGSKVEDLADKYPRYAKLTLPGLETWGVACL